MTLYNIAPGETGSSATELQCTAALHKNTIRMSASVSTQILHSSRLY